MVSAPYDDPTWEIWACQTALSYAPVKRVDRVFEFHEEAYINDPAVKERMVKGGVPVMMRRPPADLLTAERFPLEEMVAHYEAKGYAGARYFTSTIALMMGYALYVAKHEHVALYGVHMSAAEEEYSKQRQAMEYWVGVANGLGVKVEIPQQSMICKSYRIYGYDGESALISDLRRERSEMQRGLAAAKAEVDGKVQQMYEYSGALKILEKLDRMFS